MPPAKKSNPRTAKKTGKVFPSKKRRSGPKKKPGPKKRSEAKPKPGKKPTVMTQKVLQQLEEVWSLDGSDKEACLYAGISERALYYYQDENPEFLQRKRLLREKSILAARRCVIQGFLGRPAKFDVTGSLLEPHIKPSPELALRYLERKRKAEFGLRTEITGAGGKPLIKTDPEDMTNEEIAAELEERIGRAVDWRLNNGET